MTAEDRYSIKTTVLGYATAVNTSAVKDVVKFFAPDAVLMPQHGLTSIGAPTLTQFYDKLFKTTEINIQFTVHEAVVFGNTEWGFARASSQGTRTNKLTGDVTEEAKHDLFILQKNGWDWKISRYCFGSSTPLSDVIMASSDFVGNEEEHSL